MTMEEESFYGYERPDGRVGVRNHVLLLPTVVCSAHVASCISMGVNGTTPIYNQFGCAQAGEDLKTTVKTLIGLGKNPNVASVLVIALGCEGTPYKDVAEEIRKTGKRVELMIIQEVGGTIKAMEHGTRIAKELVEEASLVQKRAFKARELTVAVECGGSDWTSGIASNPAVGYAMDKLIEKGGTVIFSETTEIIGAEHILARRARNEEVKEKLLKMVARVEKRSEMVGVDIRGTNPSPGNIAGGLTTLEEKSLGAIYKGGTNPLEGALEYAEDIPKRAGLFFMDTPGYDVESVIGMVAGGAQLVVFTTGLGTPIGNPIAPVIKVTGNSETYQRMSDNIDANAGTIIEGLEDIKEAGSRIYREVLSVASGKMTKAETLGHTEFGMLKLSPSF